MEASASNQPKQSVAEPPLFALDLDTFMRVVGGLEDKSILALRGVCTALCERLDDDFWLAKVTALLGTCAGLAHLERGAGESALSWYARLSLGVVNVTCKFELSGPVGLPVMESCDPDMFLNLF